LHPDHLREELTAGQLEDWYQYFRQFNPSPARLDIVFAKLCADFNNVHLKEGEPELHPIDLLPWMDPFEGDDENLTVEDVLRECGLR
jgi:hypothetical protein